MNLVFQIYPKSIFGGYRNLEMLGYKLHPVKKKNNNGKEQQTRTIIIIIMVEARPVWDRSWMQLEREPHDSPMANHYFLLVRNVIPHTGQTQLISFSTNRLFIYFRPFSFIPFKKLPDPPPARALRTLYSYTHTSRMILWNENIATTTIQSFFILFCFFFVAVCYI